MKRTIRYTDFEGNLWELTQPRIDNALPLIQERIKHAMPVETISTDVIKDIVTCLDIECNRDLTPAEVRGAINAIKQFIIQEIDKAEKFYVSRERGALDENTKGT